MQTQWINNILNHTPQTDPRINTLLPNPNNIRIDKPTPRCPRCKLILILPEQQGDTCTTCTNRTR